MNCNSLLDALGLQVLGHVLDHLHGSLAWKLLGLAVVDADLGGRALALGTLNVTSKSFLDRPVIVDAGFNASALLGVRVVDLQASALVGCKRC